MKTSSFLVAATLCASVLFAACSEKMMTDEELLAEQRVATFEEESENEPVTRGLYLKRSLDVRIR